MCTKAFAVWVVRTVLMEESCRNHIALLCEAPTDRCRIDTFLMDWTSSSDHLTQSLIYSNEYTTPFFSHFFIGDKLGPALGLRVGTISGPLPPTGAQTNFRLLSNQSPRNNT